MLLVAVGAIGSPTGGLVANPMARPADAQSRVGDAQSRAASAQSGDASSYLAQVNALRSSVGAPALRIDGNLSSLAQGWAARLAQQGALSHTPDLSAGVTGDWTKLGENVGLGPGTDAIFHAFVDSPAHYANLVDPSFTHMGIGVVWSGDTQYTAHRFMALNNSASTAQEPPAPRDAPPTTSPPVTRPAPTTTTPPVPAVPEEPAEPVVVAPPARPERIGAIVDAFRAIPT